MSGTQALEGEIFVSILFPGQSFKTGRRKTGILQ